MESNLKDLLNSLYQALQAIDSPLVKYFQHGLDKIAIDTQLKEIGIELPEEYYELYIWKNGIDLNRTQDDKSQTWLINFGVFTSLADSIKSYKHLAGKNDYWKKNMFPLFNSTVGEFFLIDCDKQSPTYRMIFFYSVVIVDFDGVITEFDTLETLILTLTEWYEKKVLFYGEDNLLEYVSPDYEMIGMKNNPRSEYWKLYEVE